jgi:hypothetical protein
MNSSNGFGQLMNMSFVIAFAKEGYIPVSAHKIEPFLDATIS